MRFSEDQVREEPRGPGVSGGAGQRRRKVLVFQIGSLGDTVIAMPAYREIARRCPDAERYLLTNFPIGAKMVQAEALLRPCGLVDGSVEYPMPLRGWKNILRLYRQLRSLRIDALFYLTPEKRLVNLVRHYAFFRLCGIRKVHAVPWTRDLRYPRPIAGSELWESEASRLLRNVRPGRQPGPPDPADRSLNLTDQECKAADDLLAGMPGGRFLVVSVGGKVPINNWGDGNWAALLKDLSSTDPDLGIVFVGSKDERERNDRLACAWSGPKLNSCGLLTPRETAALTRRAVAFLGHDTGTLHLAAAANTRVLGIYSARNVPGKWYSDRPGDRFFYHRPPCFGCELEEPAACPHQLVCMTAHDPATIASAARELLAAAEPTKAWTADA